MFKSKKIFLAVFELTPPDKEKKKKLGGQESLRPKCSAPASVAAEIFSSC